MMSIQNELKLAVEDFKSWVKSEYTEHQIQIGNVDDYGYPNWQNLEDLCERIFSGGSFEQLSNLDKERIIFIVGRQWDLGRILNWFNKAGKEIGHLGMTKEHLLELAKIAVSGDDVDAKGQFASSLFKVGDTPEVEVTELLLKYHTDNDEFVRRQALNSLDRINYPNLGELLIKSWDYDEEFERILCLNLLFEIGHERFEEFLFMALTDDREFLQKQAIELKEKWRKLALRGDLPNPELGA